MEHQSKRRPGPDVRTADGFTAAVKQIERLLFSVSYAILCNGDACADAVQAALLKAWENRTSLKDAAAFRSWMVQIVQNESRNYLLARAREQLRKELPDYERN